MFVTTEGSLWRINFNYLSLVMQYTAVIRTLGTAGEKYQTLLNSLATQTIQPTAILVYIAEGYPIPNETIGVEQYIHVKKGMVAQRALRYDEVETEYILFLDDDLYLPPTAVATLYDSLIRHNADVISPDVFPNAKRSLLGKFIMAVSGRMVARSNDEIWGYKVMRNAGYSYNETPHKDVYWSQTNAGPCFFCRKKDFLNIRFKNEIWIEKCSYPLGEDQVMFYKMYCFGLKQLTHYTSGIVHLDAGTTTQSMDKVRTLIFADFRFKTIFWHRFIFLPEKSFLPRIWDCICIGYTLLFTLLISLLKCELSILKLKWSAITDGIRFVRSNEYKQLPRIIKQ